MYEGRDDPALGPLVRELDRAALRLERLLGDLAEARGGTTAGRAARARALEEGERVLGALEICRAEVCSAGWSAWSARQKPPRRKGGAR